MTSIAATALSSSHSWSESLTPNHAGVGTTTDRALAQKGWRAVMIEMLCRVAGDSVRWQSEVDWREMHLKIISATRPSKRGEAGMWGSHYARKGPATRSLLTTRCKPPTLITFFPARGSTKRKPIPQGLDQPMSGPGAQVSHSKYSTGPWRIRLQDRTF
jgi:hypothetical protein